MDWTNFSASGNQLTVVMNMDFHLIKPLMPMHWAQYTNKSFHVQYDVRAKIIALNL